MGPLHRSVATLRIRGDDLVPDEITALLGAPPTRAETKGVPIETPSGRVRIPRSGMWSLESTPTEPEDLAAQVAEILGQLTRDPAVWKALDARFGIDLFCGWFMASGNEGVEIPARTLRLLARRGIRLGLDIYAPRDP